MALGLKAIKLAPEKRRYCLKINFCERIVKQFGHCMKLDGLIGLKTDWCFDCICSTLQTDVGHKPISSIKATRRGRVVRASFLEIFERDSQLREPPMNFRRPAPYFLEMT